MDQKLDLSLPAVPPPPAGERVEPQARGLAGLIAGQDSAVLYHRSDRLTAMVVVVDGRVVDAIAQTGEGVVKGIAVLDELGDLAIAKLDVISVEPRLAQALPIYWRAPGATQEIVDALVRPGRRGAVLASSPARGTGVVVFDEHGIVASFVDGEMRDGGIEAILDDPDTVIVARADPQPAARTADPGPAQRSVVEPPTPEPVAPPSPAPASPYPPAPASGEFPAPPPVTPPGPFGDSAPVDAPFASWGPAFGESPVTPAAPPVGGDPQLEQRRQAIVDLLQRDLGRHTESVAAPFRTAPTLEALQGAARALAGESVRLIAPARMQRLSAQASAIARGENPPV